MFVDASALTAMLAEESDGVELIARMEQSAVKITSPIAVWEATVALARISSRSVQDTGSQVERFLDLANVQVMPIPSGARVFALDAFDRFAKGRHPAALNMGDCFAYACARHYNQPLMFKGGDFPLTDIEAA